MVSVDYHTQCEPYVRISIRDLNGKFGHDLRDRKHPDTSRYPGVSVGGCQLAAGHPVRCEMFVDDTDGTGEPYPGHWMTWEHHSKHNDDLRSGYRFDTHPTCCQPQSGYGYHCVRYDPHPGGHAFTIEDWPQHRQGLPVAHEGYRSRPQ